MPYGRRPIQAFRSPFTAQGDSLGLKLARRRPVYAPWVKCMCAPIFPRASLLASSKEKYCLTGALDGRCEDLVHVLGWDGDGARWRRIPHSAQLRWCFRGPPRRSNFVVCLQRWLPCVIWSCHPYCRKGTPVANHSGRRLCLSTRQFVVAVHKKELQKQLGRRNDKNAQERVRKTEKNASKRNCHRLLQVYEPGPILPSRLVSDCQQGSSLGRHFSTCLRKKKTQVNPFSLVGPGSYQPAFLYWGAQQTPDGH